MKRNIIKIHEDKCNGCGLCISGCHEGALKLVDGKAKLISEVYCDGLGACLPACPTNAIEIIERDAEEFDESAVKIHLESLKATQLKTIPTPMPEKLACGCSGTHAKTIERKSSSSVATKPSFETESQLRQWPVQIKLVPVNAPYFDNANILIAADCTAFAYPNIHNEFMKNKITLIGCPKLDEGDYSEKLAEIIKTNNIKSVTVLRMSVPCCGGIVNAVKTALIKSGKMIPWNAVTISTEGEIIE